MRALAAWLACVAAAVAAACVDRPVARFPHRAHVASTSCGERCMSCNDCHRPAANRREQLLPTATTCGACHEDSTRIRALLTPPNHGNEGVAFDHDRHLAMPQIKGQCVGCHAGVVDGVHAALPTMSQCFTCHEHEQQWAAGTCAPCHSARELRSLVPRSFLRHDQGFARHHGSAALSDQQLCRACHSEADCNSCHDATQELSVERRRPERLEQSFVHRGNFLTVHALEARSEPSRCLRCHTQETCDGCHAARGVSGALPNARNPHPPGWVGLNTQSSSFHGREARRDILSCAACHDQGPATNCIRCHRVGAYGGNPHPRGRWPSAQGLNSPMCRYCHE